MLARFEHERKHCADNKGLPFKGITIVRLVVLERPPLTVLHFSWFLSHLDDGVLQSLFDVALLHLEQNDYLDHHHHPVLLF